MATDHLEPASRLDVLTAGRAQPRRRARRGRFRWLVVLLILAALGVGGWYGASTLWGESKSENFSSLLTQPVAQSDLLITVVEDGNVESASNIDVKCQVAGGSTILWIVPDGTVVHKGDELVRLDASAIEDQINQQKILYEKSVATRIQAEKEYAAAKLSVQEYLEGTFVKELQAVDVLITVALESLRSAENSLVYTERMARKGYVTPLQLEAQQFAVKRAKLDLETAETSKMVLEKFTKPKMLEDLESLRDSAEARMRSEQAASDLEKARLERLVTQLEQSVIVAPQDGMVIYANDMSGGFRSGGSTVKIEEGASVRERQTIIRVPDLALMQVKVNVHESKIDRLAPGMRARVRVQGRDFKGVVRSVANQPEPTSFFSANVKEYAVIVRIEGTSEALKPGMTAEVEILIADLHDVLSVPVQAVVEQDGKFNCYVRTPVGVERRPVVLGESTNEVVQIKDGLVAGEQVVINPRAVLPEAREQEHREKSVDVKSAFGEATAPGPSAPGEAAPNVGPPPVAAPAANRPSLSALDKNGDGKISRDEAPEQMAPFFDRIDTNGDGLLDAAEMAAARARRQGSENQPPQP